MPLIQVSPFHFSKHKHLSPMTTLLLCWESKGSHEQFHHKLILHLQKGLLLSSVYILVDLK